MHFCTTQSIAVTSSFLVCICGCVQGEHVWQTEDVVKAIEENGESIALVWLSGEFHSVSLRASISRPSYMWFSCPVFLHNEPCHVMKLSRCRKRAFVREILLVILQVSTTPQGVCLTWRPLLRLLMPRLASVGWPFGAQVNVTFYWLRATGFLTFPCKVDTSWRLGPIHAFIECVEHVNFLCNES